MKFRKGGERRRTTYSSSMGGRGSWSLAGPLGGLGGFFFQICLRTEFSMQRREWGRPDLNWSLQLPKLEG